MQIMYIFDPPIPPFWWAKITRPTGWCCVVDIKKEPKINKWYVSLDFNPLHINNFASLMILKVFIETKTDTFRLCQFFPFLQITL